MHTRAYVCVYVCMCVCVCVHVLYEYHITRQVNRVPSNEKKEFCPTLGKNFLQLGWTVYCNRYNLLPL